MRSFWNITLWVAGVVAILGALGVASLNLTVLFVQVDMLMLGVGIICLLNAYFRRV